MRHGECKGNSNKVLTQGFSHFSSKDKTQLSAFLPFLLKYSDAQQVSQQISIFFKSKFHNDGGVCYKSYFEFFSGNDPIVVVVIVVKERSHSG